MAYQASRGTTDKEAEKARADANNTKNVRNAADVAIASKNPYGVAIGGTIKAADKLTGGKASEGLGKALTHMNKFSPMGKMNQKASNKMAESGLSDKIGKGASLYNQAQGGVGKDPSDTPNQVKNSKTAGGDQKNDSLPSSGDKNKNTIAPGGLGEKKDKDKDKEKDNESGATESTEEGAEQEETNSSTNSILGIFGTRRVVMKVVLAAAPFLIFLLFFAILSSSVLDIITEYDDAFGASEIAGEDNGNISYNTTNEEQKAFFERVNNVKLKYQAQGKTVEAYKIAAVYSTIHSNNPEFTYNDMSEDVISAIVEAMFEGNYYSDSIFKNNLSSKIFPQYASGGNYEDMAEETIKYIENYESLIGKEHQTTAGYNSCSSVGSCTYDIKGYYLAADKVISEPAQVKDLYVRLMECGKDSVHDYGGTAGKPMAGEALVPFEKYILGVAYQEIGPDAPAEAIKAQMVASRSYILARHADMGGWRTLKKESGKWILQVASCTQDQVYCDPDQGCSSSDGQWGQIHSGLNHNTGFAREPLPKNSPLRSYATETIGEVLINKRGYIVYTDFYAPEQEQFESLARKGLNYRQILMQVFNQGSSNLGATSILKASCNISGSSCSNASLGYTKWRQTDPAWSNVKLGSSGYTIGQVGCNITSIAILIAKSGVATNISDFNPGTFVKAMSEVGGFDSGGASQYYPVSKIAPSFKYANSVDVSRMTKAAKLKSLKNILDQGNNYVIAKVAGDNNPHWVAVDSVEGDNIKMIDPGSNATDMWSRYNWKDTKMFVYFKVG